MMQYAELLGLLLAFGGGRSGSSSGIFVGFVTNGGSFPTTRPDGSPLENEDYVRPAANSTFPFTIGSTTFENRLGKAYYVGGTWYLDAGVIQETSETPVHEPNQESVSGSVSNQSDVNKEYKKMFASGNTLPSGEFVNQRFLLLQDVETAGGTVVKGLYRYNGSTWDLLVALDNAVFIHAESHETIETFAVPVLTADQITKAYNAVMAGLNVFIVDDMEFIDIQVLEASSIDGISVRILFTDKLIVNYKLVDDDVSMEWKTLYEIAGGFGGNPKSLSTVDLDTIYDTGFYFCSVCTNRPVSANGILIVSRQSNDNKYTFQMYNAFAEDEVYVRFRDNNVWKPWQKLNISTVSITGDSGTISESNFAKLAQLSTLLKDEDNLIYYRSSESATEYVYCAKGKNVVVTKATKGYVVTAEVVETPDYLSLERLGAYLYKVTFDTIPDYAAGNTTPVGGCSAFVRDGKLYRNFDWKYDNTATFWVKCKTFEGIGSIVGLNDSNLDMAKVGQLPYHLVDGVNNNGIMISTHILYNDFNNYSGSGDKDQRIMGLPYFILSNVHSMATMETTIADYLANLSIPAELAAMEYLVQFIVTDGTTTKVITPKTDGSGYEVVDATDNPKLTNFKWVENETVVRTDLQDRPTGVERWNEIGADTTLEDLAFTLAYQTPTRLSEFIGVDGTTKASTDAELEAIYDEAHAEYLIRTRDGATWQSVHSVVYNAKGVDSLWVQEDFTKDYIPKGEEIKVDDTTIGKNASGQLEVKDGGISKEKLDSTIQELIDSVEKQTLKLTAVGGTTQVFNVLAKDVTPPLCLIFSSNAPFSIRTANTLNNWNGVIEYSTDNETWTEWSGTEVSSGTDNKLYFRGTGNTRITNASPNHRFVISATSGVKCSGNIETLLDYQTVRQGEHPTMADACYAYMFSECTSLTTPPELPATTLTNNCYTSMFTGCTSLTTAPALPATTLAYACCREMFASCTSLVTAPALPATTLANSCYESMFSRCTSLVTAPALPATTLANNCYTAMFEQCTSLVTAPALPATTLVSGCYTGLFYSCSSLKFSATQTAECPNAYRIPTSGTGTTTATNWNTMMIGGTSGTFTSNPQINTTYYTNAEVIE